MRAVKRRDALRGVVREDEDQPEEDADARRDMRPRVHLLRGGVTEPAALFQVRVREQSLGHEDDEREPHEERVVVERDRAVGLAVEPRETSEPREEDRDEEEVGRPRQEREPRAEGVQVGGGGRGHRDRRGGERRATHASWPRGRVWFRGVRGDGTMQQQQLTRTKVNDVAI